jgi:lipopolysaccharide exporter
MRSIARPFGWMISAYLQARDRLRLVLWLDISKVLSLVGLIALLGSLGGPLWACAGVGLAYGVNALASIWTVQCLDRVGVTTFLVECGPPLFACIPMVLAVTAAATVFHRTPLPVRGADVAVEIAVGGAAYVPVALLVARERSADLLRLLRGFVRSRSTRHVVNAASAPRAS